MDKAAQELTAEAALAILAAEAGVLSTEYSVLSAQYGEVVRAILASIEARVHQEKLASLRELAYGLSHEINNPLANIATRAQTLLRDETDPDRRRALATINVQAFRAHEMIADLMLFAKPPALVLIKTDAVQIASGVIAEMGDEAKEQGTALLRSGADGPLEFTADSVQLTIALRAVVLNALQALRAGGRVEIAVEHVLGFVIFRVSDNGPGLSEQAKKHMFDPYYSGREAGRGLGLGLSKCWRIVESHQGKIEVNSEPTSGTEIVMHLPASS
jgi:signal transduction histidine kinase